MKTIGITQKQLNKLPDWTIAYPKDAKAGTKYKIQSTYKGQIIYDIGEVTEAGGILKCAVITDELFQD